MAAVEVLEVIDDDVDEDVDDDVINVDIDVIFKFFKILSDVQATLERLHDHFGSKIVVANLKQKKFLIFL